MQSQLNGVNGEWTCSDDTPKRLTKDELAAQIRNRKEIANKHAFSRSDGRQNLQRGKGKQMSICRHFRMGLCLYGDQCRFAHVEDVARSESLSWLESNEAKDIPQDVPKVKGDDLDSHSIPDEWPPQDLLELEGRIRGLIVYPKIPVAEPIVQSDFDKLHEIFDPPPPPPKLHGDDNLVKPGMPSDLLYVTMYHQIYPWFHKYLTLLFVVFVLSFLFGWRYWVNLIIKFMSASLFVVLLGLLGESGFALFTILSMLILIFYSFNWILGGPLQDHMLRRSGTLFATFPVYPIDHDVLKESWCDWLRWLGVDRVVNSVVHYSSVFVSSWAYINGNGLVVQVDPRVFQPDVYRRRMYNLVVQMNFDHYSEYVVSKALLEFLRKKKPSGDVTNHTVNDLMWIIAQENRFDTIPENIRRSSAEFHAQGWAFANFKTSTTTPTLQRIRRL
jgi:hypothetical protein